MNNTSTLAAAVIIRGDVECVNCGRTLGAALRRVADGATVIRPLAAGLPIEVEVVAGRRLRCTRCGGRAFVEFDEFAAHETAKPARHTDGAVA